MWDLEHLIIFPYFSEELYVSLKFVYDIVDSRIVQSQKWFLFYDVRRPAYRWTLKPKLIAWKPNFLKVYFMLIQVESKVVFTLN